MVLVDAAVEDGDGLPGAGISLGEGALAADIRHAIDEVEFHQLVRLDADDIRVATQGIQFFRRDRQGHERDESIATMLAAFGLGRQPGQTGQHGGLHGGNLLALGGRRRFGEVALGGKEGAKADDDPHRALFLSHVLERLEGGRFRKAGNAGRALGGRRRRLAFRPVPVGIRRLDQGLAVGRGGGRDYLKRPHGEQERYRPCPDTRGDGDGWFHEELPMSAA